MARGLRESPPRELQIRMVAGIAEMIEGKERLVAGACSVPKPPDLPFRYRLPVKRRIPLIPLIPDPRGGFGPPAQGL